MDCFVDVVRGERSIFSCHHPEKACLFHSHFFFYLQKECHCYGKRNATNMEYAKLWIKGNCARPTRLPYAKPPSNTRIGRKRPLVSEPKSAGQSIRMGTYPEYSAEKLHIPTHHHPLLKFPNFYIV